MNEDQIQSFRRIFVIALALGITVLFGAMAWPFLKPLFLAAILSGLAHPVYRSLTRLFRGRRSVASVVTIILLVVLVLGPLSAFAGIVTKQAVDITSEGVPWLRQQISSGNLTRLGEDLIGRLPQVVQDNLPTQDQILSTVGGLTKNIGNFLVVSASKMTAGAAGFFLALFVMLYAMFFFLIDGRKILDRILYLIPLAPEQEERMLDRFLSVTRATVKGTLVIALVQGTLGGIGFAVAGLSGAAFWGTVMAVLSMIPVVGTPLVWIPAVIVLFATGKVLAGVLLLIWGAAVVGSIDNVLRPILVGKDTQMPDLLILIGTLGGLYVFGAVGILVGPIVCGLFLTGWQIYSESFRSALPETSHSEWQARQTFEGKPTVTTDPRPDLETKASEETGESRDHDPAETWPTAAEAPAKKEKDSQ